MAVTPTAAPNRLRNVFIAGIVIGIVGSFLFSLILPNSNVSSADIKKVNDRLDVIEAKLTTPTPTPVASSAPDAASATISKINKNPTTFIGQTVSVSGKMNSAHQGVGFIALDNDGTFLWVHFKDKLPTGTVTVKGKVTELKDQITQWKTETGWPADDSALTARLRDEKVFIEADSVS